MESTVIAREKSPLVSVIVANYNGEPYLEDALKSALSQTLTSLEVIVVDDCSSDSSVDLVTTMGEKDARLQIISLSKNGGPSRARNEGLKHAKGEWIAILDSDDLMHPNRLEWLYAFAKESAADIVADDLLVFYSDLAKPHSFLGTECMNAFSINAVDYVESNHMSGPKRNSLGFLKPMIRRSVLLETKISYDESLNNSEDYELILQLLLREVVYCVSPFLGYFYRKHEESISHRSGRFSLEALLKSDDALPANLVSTQVGLSEALLARRRSILDAIALIDVVYVLKSKKLTSIFRLLLDAPSSFLLLRSVVTDKWNRRLSIRNISKESSCEGGSILLICDEDKKETDVFLADKILTCKLMLEGYDDSACINPLAIKAEAVCVASACITQARAIVIKDGSVKWALAFMFQLGVPRYIVGYADEAVKVDESITVASLKALRDIFA